MSAYQRFIELWNEDGPMTATQDELVDRLVYLYSDRGVLEGGEDVSLRKHCGRCDACWSSNAVPAHADRAGISMPWIGARYDELRIVVIGMNLHDWGGLDAHLTICRDHIRSLNEGKQGKANHAFATGAMTYVDTIARSMAGEPLRPGEEIPHGDRLAARWDQVAFLEAVKCSPSRTGSTPYDGMFSECPTMFLRAELTILKPKAVVVLGRSKVRDPVRELLNVEWGESPGSLERDFFELNSDMVELFCLNHPSRPQWRRSHEQLVESLSRTRAGQLCDQMRKWSGVFDPDDGDDFASRYPSGTTFDDGRREPIDVSELGTPFDGPDSDT